MLKDEYILHIKCHARLIEKLLSKLKVDVVVTLIQHIFNTFTRPQNGRKKIYQIKNKFE